MAVTNYLDNSELAERIQLANGQLAKTSFTHKFGAVPAMSQNQTGTIWDVNDTLYPWSALSTPLTVNVERNDAADDGHTITVQGLDQDWNFQSEDIVINGADTTGVRLWRRVNRVFCTAGGDTNTGDIDIEAGGIGGTTIARINAGKGQTLMSVYTVPAKHTAYLHQGVCTVQANADATVDMFVRYGNQETFRVGHSFEVSGTGGPYLYQFTVPIRIPEKSDIDVRATMRSNNARITAAFDMVLVRK